MKTKSSQQLNNASTARTSTIQLLNDFTHGTMRRSISFPQLGGFKISGRQTASSAMPAIVTGWPAVQRELCFQSFN